MIALLPCSIPSVCLNMNIVLMFWEICEQCPNHLPQQMSDGQSCGSLKALCHAMYLSTLSDFNILPPALAGYVCMHVCACMWKSLPICHPLLSKILTGLERERRWERTLCLSAELKGLCFLHSAPCFISCPHVCTNTSRHPYNHFFAESQSQEEYIFPHHGTKSFLEK